MQDLEIELADRPGALADLGDVLGCAGVSIEGGGVWVTGGRGIAHFLFHDGARARVVLERAGITVRAVRDVVIQRLDQGTPGQLGALARLMAEAGVNIEVQYSDHDHRLILAVDDLATARHISEAWSNARAGRSTG